MTRYRILLTTPDYPPKLGGLSTFAVTIENVFKQLNINYELLVWKSVKDIKQYGVNKKFDYIINIHFMGGYFLRDFKGRQINFFHGSEILFYSSNFFKNIYKKIFKSKIIRFLEQSYLNVFISGATRDLIIDRGYTSNYDRDLIIHNCLEFDDSYVVTNRKLGKIIKFVSIARDVPHKNIDGCIDFVDKVARISKCQVELYITSNRSVSNCAAKVINISGIPDEHREQLYREVDFNLLLSLDHSDKGFIEGFGLTVLEAGQYGVPSVVFPSGGLKESVHHQKTGWIIGQDEIEDWWNSLTEDQYSLISKQCYQHTHRSHQADLYRRFFERVFDGK